MARKSRVEKREMNKEIATSAVANDGKKLKYRKRRFPILLRVFVVSILLGASLILGSMIGYGVIGDGEPKDVLQKSTWQHIYDIVKKE